MQSLRRLRTHRLHSWKTRNDSTNVSHALHPHCECEKSAEYKINLSSNNHKVKEQRCYCQKSPVRSKFNLKPKNSPVERCDTAKHDCIAEYSPTTEECRSSDKSRLAVPSNKLEENDSAQRSILRRDIPKLVYENDDEEESTDNNDIPFQSKEIEKNLKTLNTFRKENYFDCHSNQNLNAQVSDHKCLHKFVLNNRLVPEPLHADPFGTSRCVHCNQPAKKEPSTPKEKGNYQSSVLNKSKKHKCIKSISLTRDKDITEIEIPKNFNKYLELFDNTVDNLKKVRPLNSIALRHQKGVNLN
ncbi:hypothetical protein RN001_010597 [Aquatica leii]|uniref:Uncharacterized protein n=1 Tax=Aquatica leii TaxID=1421715 RepID=A0AAN7PA59_9COLE|nr:hypothetical protein RN001_010597 [Aquatica leii]